VSIDAIADRIARCRIATSASVVPAATATIAFCSVSDRPRVNAPNISIDRDVEREKYSLYLSIPSKEVPPVVGGGGGAMCRRTRDWMDETSSKRFQNPMGVRHEL